MTIVEFLHPLRKSSHTDLTLAVLYYGERYESKDALAVDEIRKLLAKARIPGVSKWNLADILSRSAPNVDTAGKKGKAFLWALTATGQNYVRSLLGLPEHDLEIEHDVASLTSVIARIADSETRGYAEEALICLKVGALRATVVFLWAGAARLIQEAAFRAGATACTAALTKRDSRVGQIKCLDDFAYVRDSVLLLAAQDLGIYDKNQRGVLEDALSLRNKCGHPGKYRPGPRKVGSFIEDLTGIVFS